MLGTYTYNQIIRKCVIGFGTLFNDIEVRKNNADGSTYSRMKVPLAYGSRQKFLARLEQQADLNQKVAITLPRLSFEMTGVSYDSSRKLSAITLNLKADDNNAVKKQYAPVPYNVDFELNIISKTNDDAIEIVEQILPFFQPSFNVTIKFIPEIQETKRDIPIVLDSISYDDTWDGSFQDRRYIVYTLFFTAKSYFYGPKTDSEVIRKAITKEYASTNLESPGRYRQYSVTPKALTDTTSDPNGPDAGAPDGVIDSFDDDALTGSDDFGFNEIVTFAEDV